MCLSIYLAISTKKSLPDIGIAWRWCVCMLIGWIPNVEIFIAIVFGEDSGIFYEHWKSLFHQLVWLDGGEQSKRFQSVHLLSSIGSINRTKWRWKYVCHWPLYVSVHTWFCFLTTFKTMRPAGVCGWAATQTQRIGRISEGTAESFVDTLWKVHEK